jgi:hypothetical protein
VHGHFWCIPGRTGSHLVKRPCLPQLRVSQALTWVHSSNGKSPMNIWSFRAGKIIDKTWGSILTPKNSTSWSIRFNIILYCIVLYYITLYYMYMLYMYIWDSPPHIMCIHICNWGLSHNYEMILTRYVCLKIGYTIPCYTQENLWFKTC